jgi:hypothetical protein
MIEVVIQASDPITGTRHVVQAQVLPFPDPPIKRKRLKRLAKAVEAWDDVFLGTADELDLQAAARHLRAAACELHDAFQDFIAHRGNLEESA